MSETSTLLIDDEPFYEGEAVDEHGQPFQFVEIQLSIAITEPNVAVPPERPALMPFVVDTGSDYAILCENHLTHCGIPMDGPSGGEVELAMANDSRDSGRLRDVRLWIYSNRAGIGPYPIDVNQGVVVMPPQERSVRALLGIYPLLDAGLKFELNFSTRRFSVRL